MVDIFYKLHEVSNLSKEHFLEMITYLVLKGHHKPEFIYDLINLYYEDNKYRFESNE
jgi:hypothetical protein